MPQIRNFCVAAAQITAAGNAVLYTVPDGFAFILKFAGVRNNSTIGTNLGLYMADPITGGYVHLFQGTCDPGVTTIVTTWTVLNPGQYLALGTDQQPLTYWVAGALLPFAQPAPPVLGQLEEAVQAPGAQATSVELPPLLGGPVIYVPAGG